MTGPSPAPDPARPAGRAGTAAFVIGLLLVVLMLFLGLHGPRFVAGAGDDDELAVTCGSVLAIGWPTDGSFVSSEGSRVYGDHVRRGDTDAYSRDGITRDCAERRGTYVGFMALLAVPASVCLSTALTRGRRR